MMRIDDLAEHPGAVETVAAWQHGAFGALNPSRTLAQRVQWLRSAPGGAALPRTLLALTVDGVPAGCASITQRTLTHPHLAPWLSMVYVRPEFRGQGIASALALRAAAECARMGFEQLHLFTPGSERLYRRLGWRAFDRVDLGTQQVTVMSKGVRWT